MQIYRICPKVYNPTFCGIGSAEEHASDRLSDRVNEYFEEESYVPKGIPHPHRLLRMTKEEIELLRESYKSHDSLKKFNNTLKKLNIKH